MNFSVLQGLSDLLFVLFRVIKLFVLRIVLKAAKLILPVKSTQRWVLSYSTYLMGTFSNTFSRSFRFVFNVLLLFRLYFRLEIHVSHLFLNQCIFGFFFTLLILNLIRLKEQIMLVCNLILEAFRLMQFHLV